MQVKINVKLINSKFDQKKADLHHEGEESEDNMKILWEDEFVVSGNITDFKVKNNAVYQLKGYLANDQEFCYDIPDMTIVECVMDNGQITQIPFSKKLIIDTDKQQTPKEITFSVRLKSSRPLMNPMEGVYILKENFPKELL